MKLPYITCPKRLPETPAKFPYNTTSQPVTGCVLCGKKESLVQCGNCYAVQYCEPPCGKGTPHVCDKNLVEIERRLNKAHRWGERTKLFAALMMRLDAVGTDASLQRVITLTCHSRDYQRLNSRGRARVSSIFLPILMRAGRDQDCYEFLVSRLEYPDAWPQFQGIQPWEVLDPVEPFIKRHEELDLVHQAHWYSLSNLVALTLFKIRLLKSLQAVAMAKRTAGRRVPQEILDQISRACVNDYRPNYREMIEGDQEPQIETLKHQIRQLHAAVHKSNKQFWPALLYAPEEVKSAASTDPVGTAIKRMNGQCYGMLDVERHWPLWVNYRSWRETPGAHEVIEALSGPYLRENKITSESWMSRHRFLIWRLRSKKRVAYTHRSKYMEGLYNIQALQKWERLWDILH